MNEGGDNGGFDNIFQEPKEQSCHKEDPESHGK